MASDSVVEIVLGTEEKDGFEDIGCYSRGQKIADYGDEFSVGRQ